MAFDLKSREVVGDPMPVLDRLSLPRDFLARYSVSRNGTVIYGSGAREAARARTGWICL